MSITFIFISFDIFITLETMKATQTNIYFESEESLGEAKKTSMNVYNDNRSDGNHCEYINFKKTVKYYQLTF